MKQEENCKKWSGNSFQCNLFFFSFLGCKGLRSVCEILIEAVVFFKPLFPESGLGICSLQCRHSQTSPHPPPLGF